MQVRHRQETQARRRLESLAGPRPELQRSEVDVRPLLVAAPDEPHQVRVYRGRFARGW